MRLFMIWIILFVISWPIALIALLFYPLFWLLLLPFRILGFAVDGLLQFLKELLLLPGRILSKI